ncbi:unnamed protein product [Nezara viridula]|uniref:Uncharacterized protein n=1 Tax=Nezara viridula TaxID=85310 RepID=A0A9P0H8H6_NEZVI|nr:unnamed protein product [Nezara viridula]
MIPCLLEVIGFSSRIPFQLTRPGQISSGCKRTFQSSSLPLIGSPEAPDLNPLDYRLWSKMERMACHRASPAVQLEILNEGLKNPFSGSGAWLYILKIKHLD